MFTEILNKYKESKELISIYTKEDNDKFDVGYIIAISTDMYILELRSTNGMYDGLSVNFIDDIIRISTKGAYEEKIKKLCEFNNSLSTRYDKIDNENLDLYMINYAKKNRSLISISTEVNVDIGFIKHCYEEILELESIDEYGNYDGYVYIKRKDITQIEYDTQGLKRYEILNKSNNI